MAILTMITRTSSPVSSISDLLESSGRLSRLCNHIQMLRGLQTKLRDYLEPPLNEHVIVADYRQDTLVIHTDSSAWAERTRYRTPDILVLFKDDLPGIRTVRIKNPPVEEPIQVSRRPVNVSHDTVEAIREVAGRIADPPLRAVLLRIADNLS